MTPFRSAIVVALISVVVALLLRWPSVTSVAKNADFNWNVTFTTGGVLVVRQYPDMRTVEAVLRSRQVDLELGRNQRRTALESAAVGLAIFLGFLAVTRIRSIRRRFPPTR